MDNIKKSEIAYQNKDITSKILAEKFPGKSLQIYGIDLSKIKQVLPTNLPVIQANELRIDHLFLLENDTFLLIDYESSYKDENKLKYLGYVLRILERYYKKYRMKMQIFVVIIYTADVTKEQTFEEEKLQAIEQAVKQTAKETAKEMLKEGDSIEKILRCVKHLDKKDIEELLKEVNN